MGSKKSVIVIGAGPAGMMAAIRAAQLQAQVTLIEKNPTLGKKLLLSGKGRCNLTNTSSLEEYFLRFSRQGDFLRDAFKQFFHQQLTKFFSDRGLELKVERQQRVFPATDKAESVLQILQKELEAKGIKVLCKTRVKAILSKDGMACGVSLEGGEHLNADKLILATGGLSYPFTGSTGDGLQIARKLGHKISPLRPGLVPLKTKEKFSLPLRGLTLKNIRLEFSAGKKQIVSPIGELLFTDFGISGPLVLSMSAKVSDYIASGLEVKAVIDLKPALSEQQLDKRLLREFRLNAKKNLRNTLKTLLPLKLIDLFIELLKINPAKLANQASQAERQQMVKLMKNFSLSISGTLPIEEAMITHGGVVLKEVNPRTMESRLIKGLYFCGEILDLDADTGGFNLQAAFSTGFLAGESAAA